MTGRERGGEPIGLYLHIPFCRSKCPFCDFCSFPCPDAAMVEAYVDELIRRIRLSGAAEAVAAGGVQALDTVYIGGGTPSCYGAKRIVEILDELKRIGNVRLDSEITVEVNPDTTKLEELKLLRAEGVNRLSIGVQSANNDILKIIGRRHNWLQAEQAVQAARDAGFDDLSIDLIYGLPSQTKNDWADTLSKIVEMHPEHISCYGLKLEPGTPMYENYMGSAILPDDDEQADMYSYAAEMLERYGYKQYEISNFAAPGYESRHNLKYWNMDDYMSFGPGAHSCIGSVRYSYVKDLKEYIYGVGKGISVVDEYEVLDSMEKSVEYLMLGMRTSQGISENDYRSRCQSDWRPILKVLQAFKEKGWTELTGDRWHFTVPGFLISNTLIGILLETQASGRVQGIPWVARADRAASKISLPKGEEELFTELYRQRMNSTGD